MDHDGIWQPPGEWPESYPPIDGWVQDENGNWVPPLSARDTDIDPEFGDVLAEEGGAVSRGRPVAEVARARQGGRFAAPEPERPESKRNSRPRRARKRKPLQAEADVRAMFLVGGTIGFALLLLIVALVLQSRAGAVETEVAGESSEDPPEVVFAAETAAAQIERQQEAAVLAPSIAVDQLELLETSDDGDVAVFNESLWEATTLDCLDITERVLVERSAVPVTYADNFECVPSEGSWSDVYLGVDLERTIDVEVRSLVPPDNVHASGGFEWTPATRERFLNDTSHPATMVILAADSGHNPMNQTPDQWRPADPATWCGYAIDWVAAKSRWELTVSSTERDALGEMLTTCENSDSNGPHLGSMDINLVPAPAIERIGG